MVDSVNYMITITTHINADFDCLASMVAAKKLYPEAEIVFSGSQEKNVRDFLSNTGFPMEFSRLRNYAFDAITTLVVVDTTNSERLGPFASLAGKPGLKTIFYDHHPVPAGGLGNAETHIREWGACTTVMVELLREKGIAISAEEATLFMLGIYEDTGSLTFANTRPADYQAAAWLLTQGADLNVVGSFMRRGLTTQQVDILHELLRRLEFHVINGVEVALAFAHSKEYIGDLSVVVAALRDMENLSALFVMVEMEGRLCLIARSRVSAVDAGAVAASFGGGGHPTAASAVIKDRLADDMRRELLNVLESAIVPAPTADDLMVSPVISVGKDETLAIAEGMLTRYNFNALPVLHEGRVLGIITRQTVEKALYHGMGQDKVSDYMTAEPAQVTVDTPYEAVKEIIVRQKQKVVPVVNGEGLLIGIIGRGDVLHAIYSDMLKSRATSGLERHIGRPVARDLTRMMHERLPVEILGLLREIAACADENGFTAYAVGGFVRDLLMRLKNLDVDVVIEGDGIAFARHFAARHGGKVRAHHKFQTAIIVLPGHRKIDVATARTEYYTEPAALPIVEMSSIKNDLYRRDFTLNALALKLNGKNSNHLIDFFGGQQDLKDGVIRVLHSLSFVEDPTRIFRAIRFEQRFRMALGGQTEKLLKLAVGDGILARLSGSRIFGELNLIFREDQPARTLARMAEYELWRYIHPALDYNDTAAFLCKQAEDAIVWHRLGGEGRNIRYWYIFLNCLAERLNNSQVEELLHRLGLMKNPIEHFIISRARINEVAGRLERSSGGGPVEIYNLFDGMDEDDLLCVMARVKEHTKKRAVADYMTRLRHIGAKVSGRDLIAAGIAPGPLLGKIVGIIVRENMKGMLPTKEDELRFAKAWYAKQKPGPVA